MAGGWKLHFEPTIVYVNRTSPAKFSTTLVSPANPAKRPPPGNPGFVRVRLRITDDGTGSPPVAPDAAPVDASLEFVSRIAGTQAFTQLAVAKGRIVYEAAADGTKHPKFTCLTRKVPGSATTEPDFTPSSSNEVARSDWMLRLEEHPTHFDVGIAGRTLPLRLAWQFDDKKPELQLGVRLLVGGQVVVGEQVNSTLTIPLRHANVDEDLTTPNPTLTLFGVRTAMPASLTRPSIPIGSRRFHVFLDPSVTTFIDGHVGTGKSSAVRTAVKNVLDDLGIPKVEVVMTGDASFPAEQQAWAKLVGQTSGKFHCTNIRNLTSLPPNSPSNAETFIPNRSFVFTGDGNDIPFFDFFVGLESSDPPATELGIGEQTASSSAIDVKAATKRLVVPIVLFGGASPSLGGTAKGIRGTLSNVEDADKPNVVANVILHEVGHALGLRHGARIDDSVGYTEKDADGVTNSLLFPTAVLQPVTTTSNKSPCRLNFFGPVQQKALRDAFFPPPKP